MIDAPREVMRRTASRTQGGACADPLLDLIAEAGVMTEDRPLLVRGFA